MYEKKNKKKAKEFSGDLSLESLKDFIYEKNDDLWMCFEL